MIYLYIILLAFVLAWREIQILIDRGSYKKENLKVNLYWYLSQQKWYKNFDSFHASNGLATLIIIELIVKDLPVLFDIGWIGMQMHVIIYWMVFMQIRNLFLHVIYKK